MKKVLLLFLLVAFATMAFALNPPSNFTASVEGQSVVLDWRNPTEPGMLTQSTDEYQNTLGVGNGLTYTALIRFTPEELTPFNGFQLNAISVILSGGADTKKIKIWKGCSVNPATAQFIEGTLLAEQNITEQWTAAQLQSKEYKSIALTNPVTINANEDLWIGFETAGYARDPQNALRPGYTVSYDYSNPVLGGNMLIVNGRVYMLSTAFGYDSPQGNWMIKGTVTNPAGARSTLCMGNNNTNEEISFESSLDCDIVTKSSDTINTNRTSNTRYPSYMSAIKVFRNDELVYTYADSKETLIAADINLEPGNYTYKLKAVDSANVESNFTEEIQVTIASDNLITPTNFQARALNVNNAYLEWNTPGQALPGNQTIKNYNNEPITSMLTDGGKDLSFYATRFTPAQLANFNGQELTQVGVGVAKFTYLKVMVWQGGSWIAPGDNERIGKGDPGTLVSSQWCWSPEENSINVVSLATPVTIDASQELWIGFKTNGHRTTEGAANANNKFVLQTDSGPASIGVGDLTKHANGKFFYSYRANELLTVPTSHHVNSNFVIKGYVRDTASNSARPLRSLTGYKVYRNNAVVATITDPTKNSFLDSFLEEGNYEYKVAATYHSGDSPATDVVNLAIAATANLAPSNVNATKAGINDVRISWNLPNWSGATESLKLDDGNGPTATPAIPSQQSGNLNFAIAHRYVPADLTAVNGHTLSYISFYANTTGTFYVRAWQGGSVNAENKVEVGDLLVNQLAENVIAGQWNRVMLVNPITIDASKELLISAAITENDDMAVGPFAVDGTAATANKGNLISDPGANAATFFSFSRITNNFLLRGWTTAPANRTTRSLDSYKIYKGGEVLTTITDLNTTQYIDNDLAEGDYIYHMTAVYNGTESDESDVANINITIPVPLNIRATPNLANNSCILTWTYPQGQDNTTVTGFKAYKNGTEIFSGNTRSTIITNFGVERAELYVTAMYGDTESGASEKIVVENFIVGANDNVSPLNATCLAGAFPNPFNPTTTIRFDLKANANVKLNIYNVKGQKVRSLKNEKMTAGSKVVTFNGKDDKGNSLSSGIYFVKMSAGRYTASKKMILLK